MPYYQHITLVESRYCGEAAAPYLPFSYLAASHGMTINTSMVARFDTEKTRQYCQTLREEIGLGKVRDDTIYILHPKHLENITEDYPYETLYYVGANIRYRPRYFMHVPNNPPSFNSQLEHFKKI